MVERLLKIVASALLDVSSERLGDARYDHSGGEGAGQARNHSCGAREGQTIISDEFRFGDDERNVKVGKLKPAPLKTTRVRHPANNPLK
jgi:hypothetical protein